MQVIEELLYQKTAQGLDCLLVYGGIGYLLE